MAAGDKDNDHSLLDDQNRHLIKRMIMLKATTIPLKQLYYMWTKHKNGSIIIPKIIVVNNIFPIAHYLLTRFGTWYNLDANSKGYHLHDWGWCFMIATIYLSVLSYPPGRKDTIVQENPISLSTPYIYMYIIVWFELGFCTFLHLLVAVLVEKSDPRIFLSNTLVSHTNISKLGACPHLFQNSNPSLVQVKRIRAPFYIIQ